MVINYLHNESQGIATRILSVSCTARFSLFCLDLSCRFQYILDISGIYTTFVSFAGKKRSRYSRSRAGFRNNNRHLSSTKGIAATFPRLSLTLTPTMIIEKKKGGHRYYGDNKIEKDFRTIYRVIRRYFFFFYSRQNIRGNRYRQNFKF